MVGAARVAVRLRRPPERCGGQRHRFSGVSSQPDLLFRFLNFMRPGFVFLLPRGQKFLFFQKVRIHEILQTSLSTNWSFENLYLAYRKARKESAPGRAQHRLSASRRNSQRFLQEELISQNPIPRRLSVFTSMILKKRLIFFGSSFSGTGLIHHALCRVIEPIWNAVKAYPRYLCQLGG